MTPDVCLRNLIMIVCAVLQSIFFFFFFATDSKLKRRCVLLLDTVPLGEGIALHTLSLYLVLVYFCSKFELLISFLFYNEFRRLAKFLLSGLLLAKRRIFLCYTWIFYTVKMHNFFKKYILISFFLNKYQCEGTWSEPNLHPSNISYVM